MRKAIFFKNRRVKGHNHTYSLAAGLSLFLLVGAIMQRADGPLGPDIETLASSGVSYTSTYDTFEIVYFGTAECLWCKRWRTNHLPKWQRAAISRKVRLTQQPATCDGDPTYTEICREVLTTMKDVPAFALVHRDSGKLLAAGTGIDGFYKVSQLASEWVSRWEERELTASTTA